MGFAVKAHAKWVQYRETKNQEKVDSLQEKFGAAEERRRKEEKEKKKTERLGEEVE